MFISNVSLWPIGESNTNVIGQCSTNGFDGPGDVDIYESTVEQEQESDGVGSIYDNGFSSDSSSDEVENNSQEETIVTSSGINDFEITVKLSLYYYYFCLQGNFNATTKVLA